MSADAIGSDWSCLDGLESHGALVSGALLVAQDVAARLQTPRGRLRRHPDYGIDLRALCSAKIDAVRLYAIRSQVAAEIRKDERVSALAVDVTRKALATPGTEAVKIAISGRCASGPFGFVVEASKLGVDVIWPKAGGQS